MKQKILSSLFILLLFIVSVSNADFATDFWSFDINSETQPFHSEFKSLDYIFVTGFLNEFLSLDLSTGNRRLKAGYFEDNIEFLLKVGVPKENIHKIVNPKSTNGIVENSLLIDNQILSILEKKPNAKLVIVAHSKGAFETIAWSILHAKDDLIKKNLVKIYSIQGALKGSAVADLMTKQKIAWKPRIVVNGLKVMPRIEYLTFKAVSKIGFQTRAGLSIVCPLCTMGLENITTLNASLTGSYLKSRLQKRFKGTRRQLNSKVKYIRSFKHPFYNSESIDCTGWYLRASESESPIRIYPVKNDGLVKTKDQMFNFIGESIAILPNTDHSDLVLIKGPLGSREEKSYRYSLMSAVIKDLGR